MKQNRFKSQSGCFKCSICERQTRDAGQGRHHCPQCDQWTMIENGLMNDEFETEAEKAAMEADILSLKNEAANRGGSRAALGLDEPDGVGRTFTACPRANGETA